MKVKKITFDEFDNEPGSYCITDNGLLITLPCGCNFMPQGKWEEKDSEDETKITLHSSILCRHHGERPDWHGFLREGKFISV
jgi:hypothetical protein